MIPIAPIHDRVLITINVSDRVSAAGLVIPHVNDPERQTADERDVGTVVAVGPGKRLVSGERRPMSVAPEQAVIFGRNKGQQIRYQEADYVVLLERDLIGRIARDGFEPLNDYIVAEEVQKETTTEAGVIVPETSDRDEATVIAVGPGKIEDDGELTPSTVQPGDTILFNPRMAEPFEHAGRKFIALHEEHIVCISNRDPAAA